MVSLRRALIVLLCFAILCAVAYGIFEYTYEPVQASSQFMGIELSSNTYSPNKTLPPTMDIRFNPSGTHVDSKGNLKIRLDFYPREEDKSYKQCLTGKEILSPVLSHFVIVPANVAVGDVLKFIQDNFYADVTATIDDIMVQENSMHLIAPYMRDRGILAKQTVAVGTEDSVVSQANLRLAGLVLAAGSNKGTVDVVESQSIIVGSDAIDRAATRPSELYMRFTSANPANASGTISAVNVYMNAVTTAVARFGTVYAVSTNWSSRDYEQVGALSVGLNSITGLSIDVVTSDLLGMYQPNASGTPYIEAVASGATMHAMQYQDFPFTDVASTDSTYTLSLQGTGTEAFSGDIANAPTDALPFGAVVPNYTYYAKGVTPSNPVSDNQCTYTLTNNGDTSKINIKGTNATEGIDWTLVDSPPINVNEFSVTAYQTGTDPAGGVKLTTSDQQFIASLTGAGAHTHWDFKFETGDDYDSTGYFQDGVPKSSVITLTAVTP